MKVFLSWSGERSRSFASSLRDWLPSVIQVIEPWMSSEDVEKGAPWFQQIGESLGQAKGIGIFCVTPENMSAPWLNFEAGFLAATGGRARVCVALLGLEPAELSSPLNLFQATKVDQADFKRLVETLNQQTERPLGEAVLDRAFTTFWPQLEQALVAVAAQKAHSPKPKKRSTEDLLGELVESNRRIEAEVSYIRRAEARRYGPEASSYLSKRMAGLQADRRELIEFLLTVPPDSPVTLDSLLALTRARNAVAGTSKTLSAAAARRAAEQQMTRRSSGEEDDDGYLPPVEKEI